MQLEATRTTHAIDKQIIQKIFEETHFIFSLKTEQWSKLIKCGMCSEGVSIPDCTVQSVATIAVQRGYTARAGRATED